MDATQQYLVSESNKNIGASLDILEKLANDMRSINLEKLAELSPDALPAVHSTLQKVSGGLTNLSVVAMVLSAISTTPEENDASL